MSTSPNPPSPALSTCPGCLCSYAPQATGAYCCPSCFAELSPGERILFAQIVALRGGIEGWLEQAREQLTGETLSKLRRELGRGEN